MNTTLKQITEKIRIHKPELQKKYFVKQIGIFGSWVRGEEKKESDIDILIETEKPIDFFQFLEMEEKLSEWTGTKVDLVSKKALKPEIGKQILKEVQYL